MYSKNLKTVAQLLMVVCLVVIAFVASCKKTEERNTFPITITSIDIWHDGASVYLSQAGETEDKDTIFIRLNGSIGPNECYELYNVLLYTQQNTKNKHIIEAEGIQNKPKAGSICVPNESILDHTLYIWFTEEAEIGEHIFYTKDMRELGRVNVR